MRWRRHTSSIVVVVLALFAVGYAYLDRGSVTENERKARTANVFPAWRSDDLARIMIEHGGERIVLERQKDDAGEPQWWLRAPQVEKANQEAVDKLASALQYASVARKVDPGANVMDTSRAPRATGEIGMGAVSYRFALGGEAKAPEGAAYLRVDGLGTDVVSRDVATAILQGSDAYRSRTLVPYLSVELARLDVKNESGGFAITRVDDVSFKLGSGLRASREKLDGVWSALAEMRAESFLDDATAAAHVASPRATVTMTPKDAARPAGVLRVGDACSGSDSGIVVVRDAPTKLSACAPKGALDGLDVAESALADTHLFAAHDDEVAELRIETLPSGPAIELARKESAWREKAPVERDLSGEDADAASALVTAVARAEGASPQKSDAPFAAKARVTLHRVDGDTTEVVEVGAPDASGDAIVRRAFDGARLLVTAAVARRLVPSQVALRGREVWSPSIEGAPVLAVETHCDGVDQRAVREGAAWALRAPAGYAADNASVLDVIDTVQRLRAESWIADADDGHLGFGACTLVLELAGDAGPRVARLDLGKDGEGGVYAKSSDGPAVFVAPKVLRERAGGWLIDLHGLAPASVATVSLERDGKRLVFSNDAGDDATDDVLRAANVLRADSAVHLGPARPDEGLAHPALTLTLHGADATRTVLVGAPLPSDGKMRYARIPGVDATFVVEAGRLRAFFDRF